MRRWIGEAIGFLLVLGVLQLARLAVVLICTMEALTILGLWGFSIFEYGASTHATWLWIPIGATFLLVVQIALWQFTWLRLAQRGGQWRALAECFSRVVRYPISRQPHPWE